MLDKLIDLLISLWERINPFIIVYEYEWVILLRVGKVKKVLNTGFHLLPLKVACIDNTRTCPKKPDTYRISGINITTNDNKTANVGVAIEYEICDPVKWLIENATSESNFHDISWGTCGEYLTTLDWSVLKEKATRTRIKNKVADSTEHLGVNVIGISFGDIVLHKVLTIFKE